MGSENPIGADNQQETNSVQLDPLWVDGPVAVEGGFLVSFKSSESVVLHSAAEADLSGLESHRDVSEVVKSQDVITEMRSHM
jgi:hypothetical protein